VMLLAGLLGVVQWTEKGQYIQRVRESCMGTNFGDAF
jgi:hypothetical protein